MLFRLLRSPLLGRFGLCLLLLLPLLAPAQARDTKGLLRNGGFEGGSSDGQGGGLTDWQPFGAGYDIDRATRRSGDQSIRCDILDGKASRGAQVRLELNQTRPLPVLVTGWSKAAHVQGLKDSDYSLYIDLEYTDGTPLWGEVTPFDVGTHDWQRRQVRVLPVKPIKTLTIYALFRHHAGTVWFDDFAAYELSGPGIFDGQPLTQPQATPAKRAVRVTGRDGLALDFDTRGDITSILLGGRDVSSADGGGFYVRDVAADGPLVPMRGLTRPYHDGGATVGFAAPTLHVRFNAKIVPHGDAISIDGDVTDTTKTDRAVTVYLALPVHADGWQWGSDIRHAETIAGGEEYTNQTGVNVGATGGLSLYPFACLSDNQNGIGIANQMDWPSVYRLFYNASSRRLVIAWDFALTGKTAAWPSHNARFRCTLFRLPPDQAAWGFRAAALRFYHLNAPNFERRTHAEGIWMPFSDPSKVENPADFGFAFHEGDNSIKSDDALGILSFRYTEPMSYWMPMPPAVPRTYDEALAMVQTNAEGTDPDKRKWARAVLDSGTQDPDGHFNLQFQNAPWTNGAVFVLDPNPELPASPDKPTKASLSYTIEMAQKMYGEEAQKTRGVQDGEYLDSLESWADTLDFRPTDIAACPYPIPFDLDTRRPVLPQWYNTHTFTRFLSNDLHNRGKLLMANTSPVRFSIYAPLLDVAGIETNWLDENRGWQPDDDAVFNLRRTLSYQKPYLLLQNTNFDKFTSPMVEKYFQRSLFYGVFPGMFSVDASNSPYWETPRWYNRDRALFKKYIPIVKRLSAAGWEPITNAKSANQAVYVERFGPRVFTLFNDSAQPHDTTLNIDLRALGLPAGNLRVANLITNADISARRVGDSLVVSTRLNPEESQALELK